MPKQTMLELLRLVDWMMALPKPQELLFRQEHAQWEKEKQMPYITSFERLAREEGEAQGRAEGLLEAIELGLKLRFSAEGLRLFPSIQQIVDIDVLRRIKQAIVTAATTDDIRQFLP